MRRSYAYSGPFPDETGNEITEGNIRIEVLYHREYRTCENDKGCVHGLKWHVHDEWICQKSLDSEVIGIYEILLDWTRDIKESLIMEWVLKTFPYASEVCIRDGKIIKLK